MKRVEAIISAEKVSAVNEALRNAGVGGATILDAKGRVDRFAFLPWLLVR